MSELMSRRSLILASSSPRRQELIRVLGLPYEVFVSHADEQVATELSPSEVVEELAVRKALTVYEQQKESGKNAVVIGADTVVVLDGNRLGKPKDEDDAVRMLTALSGQTHCVYSGVACIDLTSGEKLTGHRQTSVTFKQLSKEQILRYIDTGEPMDKAGAYGIQGLGATLVDNLSGDYFTVVGLPLSLLSDMLKRFEIEVI